MDEGIPEVVTRMSDADVRVARAGSYHHIFLWSLKGPQDSYG